MQREHLASVSSFTIALFVIVFTFSGCIKEETTSNTPIGNLETLWKIVDEHYCFFDYKHDVIGLDWDSIHRIYAEKIHPQMGADQLFEVLSDMLSELRDGHVNLYYAGDVGRNWSWYEDYPLNYSQELRDAYLGTDYRIASGLSYRILDDNIGYVVCSSFNNGIGEGNLTAMLEWLQLCKGIIIDVRNNGGGTLTTAESFAQRFTNERLLVGYMSHKTGTGHSDFSSPTPEYLEPSISIRWQKRVIVLTNRRCFSATNTFVRDMKCCANVMILGDTTGGGSGMPFSSELPNGWSVRFSACPSFDREMRQIEFGIAPDSVVNLSLEEALRGKDSMIETARRILSSD